MSSGSTPWVSSALNPSHAPPIKMAHMFTYAYIGNWMTLLVRSMCACTYANIGLQQQIHNNLVLHAPAQPSLAAHFKYSSMNLLLQFIIYIIIQNNHLCQLSHPASIPQKRGNHCNAVKPFVSKL